MHQIGSIAMERFKDRHADAYNTFVDVWRDYSQYVIEMEERNPDGVSQLKPAKAKADLEELAVKDGFLTLPPKPLMGQIDYPEGGKMKVKLVRSFLSYNYGAPRKIMSEAPIDRNHTGLAGGDTSSGVPYGQIGVKPSEFADEHFWPPNIAIKDPSGMKKEELEVLLEHWRKRQLTEHPSNIFRFRQIRKGRTGSLIPAAYDEDHSSVIVPIAVPADVAPTATIGSIPPKARKAKRTSRKQKGNIPKTPAIVDDALSDEEVHDGDAGDEDDNDMGGGTLDQSEDVEEDIFPTGELSNSVEQQDICAVPNGTLAGMQFAGIQHRNTNHPCNGTDLNIESQSATRYDDGNNYRMDMEAGGAIVRQNITFNCDDASTGYQYSDVVGMGQANISHAQPPTMLEELYDNNYPYTEGNGMAWITNGGMENNSAVAYSSNSYAGHNIGWDVGVHYRAENIDYAAMEGPSAPYIFSNPLEGITINQDLATSTHNQVPLTLYSREQEDPPASAPSRPQPRQRTEPHPEGSFGRNANTSRATGRQLPQGAANKGQEAVATNPAAVLLKRRKRARDDGLDITMAQEDYGKGKRARKPSQKVLDK